MRQILIITAVYFVPAFALLAFAWIMDKAIDRHFNNLSKKARR